MKKNRKKAKKYRFNGVWGITCVGCADLQELIDRHVDKANDPNDLDDKKWVDRWLSRFRQELAKKERAIERKRIESEKRNRINAHTQNVH